MSQRRPVRLVGLSGRESRHARAFSGVTNVEVMGIGVENPATALDIDGHLTLSMQQDPGNTGQGPAEEKAVVWVSDGEHPPFDKGDIVATVRRTISGEIQYKDFILADWSTGLETVLITDENGDYVVCAGVDSDDPDAYIIGDYNES